MAIIAADLDLKHLLNPLPQAIWLEGAETSQAAKSYPQVRSV